MEYKLTAPLSKADAAKLRAGDTVLLSGTIYTARDAAHKRLCALAAEGKPLPFAIEDAVVYYAGPTPARPGGVIGSVGPTTSYRMDAYAPTLLDMGQTGMIGKGARGPEVVAAMRRTGAVYFAAIGGAARLHSARSERLQPEKIVGADMIIAAQGNQVTDGQLVFPVFITGIYLLRCAEVLGYLFLGQIPVFPKLAYDVYISFHANTSAPILGYT